MSVLYAAAGDELDWLDTPPPWRCAECAEVVDPPLVYWRAAEKDVFYHPSCALAVAPHLIGDAREATLAAGSEDFWRGRAIATVRHRLKTEETSAA